MNRLLAELGESFRMATSALAAHKLRSALTLLGVLVGVFSIILVMTAMRAMKNNIEQNLGQLGSKSFVLQKMPGAYFSGPEGYMKLLRRKTITYAQATRFKEKAAFAPYVGLHSGFETSDVTSRYARTPPNVSIEGVTPGAFQISNWSITDGRALLDSDLDSAREVCVLSVEVARTLFPRGSALGKRIKIASINYTVVGLFERAGADADAGGVAAIPLTTGLNRYGRWRDTEILVQARDPASVGDAMEQARGLLRAIRKVAPGQEDDFEILSSDSMIKQFETMTFAVRTGLSLVSSIALLAAGVGIMNIMLVSVTERTREIGIRRAIGAKKRNIMTQFIIEAVVLCEIGGLLGVVLGMAGANALAIYLLKLPPAFPVDWAIIGLVICSLIGIVFGSYPAYKAANLDPIESLRYE
ncbi:MAG: putative transport system permease protein [Chthoniobacter sp.]|jgi:putative ABC transport system permease protein|nr:putative transport system permease protein [Chthoniobacter sp.]